MSFAADITRLQANIGRLDTFMNGAEDATVALGGLTRPTLAGLLGFTASDTAPAAPWPGRVWYDTSDAAAPVLRVRNEANTAWLDILAIARGEQLVLATRTAAYALVAADQGTVVIMNSATTVALTVGSPSMPIGAQVHVVQLGAGQVTITPGSGVSVVSSGALALRRQYAIATLLKIAATTWLLFGELEAA